MKKFFQYRTADHVALARHLRSNATRLSLVLNETARLVPRFADRLSSKEKAFAFASEEHASLIDYLARWVDSGDPVFRALYLGERAKMAYDPTHSAKERNAAIKRLIESDARLLVTTLADKANGEILTSYFLEMAGRIEVQNAKELRILFIGDCLHLDVTGFLTDDIARSCIAIHPTYLTDKNPAGLAESIRMHAKEPFDAVFYSPFTYENGLVVSQVLMPSRSMVVLPGSRTRAAVEQMMAEVEQVLTVLARAFAAPIFVHNTVLVRRHTGRLRDSAMRRLSAAARHKIRTEIDNRIGILLERLNGETFPHVYRLDELDLLKDWSEGDLGGYLHHHGLQHPARLGAAVAGRYAMILETIGHLVGKKLIVCDLDDTLWQGVIGEGAVVHHADRQNILRRLKEKGVVLAIASKNDPKNVKWDGGVLRAEDFVSSQISWSPKIAAFPAIENELNLKRKDFVFVDDRPDERGLVTETYPEIRTVDAEDARTWEMFDLWGRLLGDGSDMDRTQMYLDRAKRLEFETDAVSDGSNKAELFAKLGLRLTVSEASHKTLNRVLELINRTNQFNMTAARTTFDEVQSWSKSPLHQVWVASMQDKFGEMGIVSVIVVDLTDNLARIPIFVLSCRVFGYEVEHVLLNLLKKEISKRKLSGIIGHHIPTMVNTPCRSTYFENGFRERDDVWLWNIGNEERPDPTWISITLL